MGKNVFCQPYPFFSVLRLVKCDLNQHKKNRSVYLCASKQHLKTQLVQNWSMEIVPIVASAISLHSLQPHPLTRPMTPSWLGDLLWPSLLTPPHGQPWRMRVTEIMHIILLNVLEWSGMSHFQYKVQENLYRKRNHQIFIQVPFKKTKHNKKCMPDLESSKGFDIQPSFVYFGCYANTSESLFQKESPYWAPLALVKALTYWVKQKRSRMSESADTADRL